MRFVSALLFVALTGSVTLADEAKPADPKPEVVKKKVPLRVVKMLPESRQVLLFDKNKGTHVVAEVGQDVDGYIVDDIDGDEVTLVAETGTQVILTAPAERGHRKDKAATKAGKAPAVAEPAPVDPYADPAETAPVTAGDNGVRVADSEGAAPVDPYANMDPSIAAFVKAVGADPSPAAAAASSAPAPAPASKPSAAAPAKAASDGAALGAAITGTPTGETAAAAVSPGPTTSSLKRAEVDAALADFAATASTFRATFTAQGLRFDDVTGGSLLAKVGLQKGDIVTTVDGQPLRSLDDAANLYARLPTARGTTLVVQRAGKPVTLRVAIQ